MPADRSTHPRDEHGGAEHGGAGDAASARGKQARAAPSPADFSADALDFDEVRGVLAGFAAGALGRDALLALAPLPDDEVPRALARTGELLALAGRGGRAPALSGLVDPRPLLAAARRGARALDEEDLVALRAFLDAAVRLVSWAADHAEAAPECVRLVRGAPDLLPLCAAIDAVCDAKGRVHDDASPLLARLRREIARIERGVDRALREIVRRPEIKAVLSDTAVHRRGGRLVIAVRAKSRGRVTGIVHDHSHSGETVFVEPREVIELGNRLSECGADERREVARLLVALLRTILEHEPALADTAERLARLEVASAGAGFAARHSGRVPELVAIDARAGEAGRGLLLRRVRHPLLLREVEEGRLTEVVPVDLRLGEDFDLLILTGPNTGGKTLALKTAGLAVLMVRCGLPLACDEGTRVPLYRGVVADIGDEQEIRQSLSTFSSHLARIKAGLARAGRDTLFLLDELGGGTDPEQGAALSEALLEHLLERGVPTLASTHIGRLKEFAFKHARAENASVEFDPETLAPRYRVLIGTPGESAALVIARRLGLPGALVDRAEERIERRDEELAQLMVDVGHARVDAERARSQAEDRLADASREARAAEEVRVELERKGELIEVEAQRDLEERVRAARDRVTRLGAFLEQVPQALRETLARELAGLDDELSGAALNERRKGFLEGLRKGGWVYLPRYKKRCLVQRVDREKREVAVQLGGLRMSVSFDEVSSYESA